MLFLIHLQDVSTSLHLEGRVQLGNPPLLRMRRGKCVILKIRADPGMVHDDVHAMLRKELCIFVPRYFEEFRDCKAPVESIISSFALTACRCADLELNSIPEAMTLL